MKAIEGVLKEELSRLLALGLSYMREIKKLPKGSIQRKKIKGGFYPYLVFRKRDRIVYEYVGNLSQVEFKKLEAEIEQRRKYENLLREVRQNVTHLKKIVYARKRAV